MCGMSQVPIRDYRDLVAWQEAIELAVECDIVADRLPRKAWHLASQLKRAANSVHANIAEGNGKQTLPDYIRHLKMADSSLNEVESHLFFIARRYPDLTARSAALARVARVAKPLAGLIKSLRRKHERER